MVVAEIADDTVVDMTLMNQIRHRFWQNPLVAVSQTVEFLNCCSAANGRLLEQALRFKVWCSVSTICHFPLPIINIHNTIVNDADDDGADH